MKAHAGSRPLLIAYFPLGDPETPVERLDLYAQSGVDFVEFGWPARDPYFDGPDVREAMARSSQDAARVTLREALRRLHANETPPRALMMTYAEADHLGLEGDSLFDGLDAVLVVAAPSDPHRVSLEAAARRAGAAVAAFLPLPLREDDVAAARRAEGYVMLQAAPGVTGPRASLDPSNSERIARLRREGVVAPIVLGFGLSQAAHARAAVAMGADGIVVGSAALRAGPDRLAALLQDLRSGLDG